MKEIKLLFTEDNEFYTVKDTIEEMNDELSRWYNEYCDAENESVDESVAIYGFNLTLLNYFDKIKAIIDNAKENRG